MKPTTSEIRVLNNRPPIKQKIEVRFGAPELVKEYAALKEGNPNEQIRYKQIKSAIDDIRRDPRIGEKVDKSLWKKSKYGKYEIDGQRITELRRYELDDNWRLLYSNRMDEVYLIAFVLEWGNHKNYDRRIGYS